VISEEFNFGKDSTQPQYANYLAKQLTKTTTPTLNIIAAEA
jgi:hypothetical protein